MLTLMTYNPSSQFVYCPKCDGSGKDDPGHKDGARKNQVCNNCGGIGLGSFIKSDFLYWGYDLRPAKILVRQSKVIFDYVINIIFLLLGLSGIASLVIWWKNNAFISGGGVDIGTLLTFWGVKSHLILFFWLGILFLLFFYFRLQRAEARKVPVKIFSYKQQQKLSRQFQNIPNNWQELKRFKTKLDVSKSFDTKVIKVVEQAYQLALQMKHKEVLPAHVLAVLVEKGEKKEVSARGRSASGGKEVGALFARLGIYKGKLGPKIISALKQQPVSEGPKPVINEKLKQSFIEAYFEAQDHKNTLVQFSDLVVPLIKNDKLLQEIFNELDANIEQIDNVIVWAKVNEELAKKEQEQQISLGLNIKRKMGKSTLAVATPILNHFCTDVVEQVQFKIEEEYIVRDEVEEIFAKINSGIKQIILNGPEGTGKKIIIRTIAQRVIAHNAPKVLRHKRLLKLNLNKLAQEADQIDKEKKLLVIIDEVRRAGNVVLIVEDMTNEIWQIISRSPKPFYLLATTSEQLGGSVIKVSEPKGNLAIQILESKAALIELKQKVYFSYQAVEAAWQMAQTYFGNETPLLKAIKLLEESAVRITHPRRVSLGLKAVPVERNITERTVAEVVSAETKVPVTKVMKGEK